MRYDPCGCDAGSHPSVHGLHKCLERLLRNCFPFLCECSLQLCNGWTCWPSMFNRRQMLAKEVSTDVEKPGLLWQYGKWKYPAETAAGWGAATRMAQVQASAPHLGTSVHSDAYSQDLVNFRHGSRVIFFLPNACSWAVTWLLGCSPKYHRVLSIQCKEPWGVCCCDLGQYK